ncbi:cell polarity protein [Pseudohyphozyma bogoriensis]|nr:cell polarity protein [Pseudohyphozyma bogoriensis]
MSLRSQSSGPRPNHAPTPSSDYSGFAKSSVGSSINNQPSGAFPSRSDSNAASVDLSRNAGADPQSVTSPTMSYAKAAPVSVEQSRAIARTHFDALRDWLRRENALGNSTSSRNTAREKLTRLTRQQFQELSTDVYDELMRRIEDAADRPGERPFLAVRAEFHPKRNQARQKLATLPLGRFRDLASDVYFELERRYPEFAEDDSTPNSNDPVAPATSYSPPPAQLSQSGAPSNQASSTLNSRRIPTPTGSNASNDIVVPNKSTFVVEESTPLGGASSGAGAGAGGGAGTGLANGSADDGYGAGNGNGYNDREYEEMASPSGGQSVGLRGMNPSRVSETSSIGTRFIGNYAGSTAASEAGGRRSWEYEEKEKVKADYEYKITMLQNRVTDLQREADDARESLRRKGDDSSRVRDLEDQLGSQRERFDSQSTQLQRLQSDYDSLQSTRSRDASSVQDSSRLRADLERVSRERQEADDLANELRTEVSSLVDELRSVNSRYEELLESVEKDKKEKTELEEEALSWRRKYEQAKTELRNVKATSQLFVGSIKVQGDHMPASADGLISDVNVTEFQTSIDDLLQAARSKEPASVLPAMRAVVSAVDKIDRDVQAVDNRRLLSFPVAEQDRLQSVKANTNATLSNLMTASKNHATSFGVSPVSLLDAAASHLSNSIIDLVRILKIRKTGAAGRVPEPIPEERPPVPPTKSNGYGGGHNRQSSTASSMLYSAPARDSLSSTIASPPQPPRAPLSNSSRDEYNPPPRSYGASIPAPAPQQQSYDRDREEDRYRNTTASPAAYGGTHTSPYSPPVEDRYGQFSPQRGDSYDDMYGRPSGETQFRGSVLTYGSPDPNEERPQQSIEELKNYLENQTEAIVHSIQSLLSAIRSGAQGEQLNENLTRIITIVSSIVAISKDALPESARAEGEDILHDLTDNCDKLSDMSQSSATAIFDKQTKQAMASASFGVAKSLKALNALLDNKS